MRLIETWLADPERAFDLFAKFPAEETGFENPAAGMDREQFATAGLKLTLAKARELGIEEAYLSVHKTNPASLAVQQHCGARIDHEDKTECYTRIATCMESDGLYARGD